MTMVLTLASLRSMREMAMEVRTLLKLLAALANRPPSILIIMMMMMISFEAGSPLAASAESSVLLRLVGISPSWISSGSTLIQLFIMVIFFWVNNVMMRKMIGDGDSYDLNIERRGVDEKDKLLLQVWLKAKNHIWPN